MEAEQQAIDHTPRAWLIAEHCELHRQVVEVSGDEIIDAARVGGEGGAVGVGKSDVGILGDAAHAKFARLAIAFEERRAENFGERARGETSQGVHLEEAILCGDVPLNKKGILLAGGADVRLAVRIEGDGGARGEGSVERAGALRQGTPHVPINKEDGGDQRGGDRNVHNFNGTRNQVLSHLRGVNSQSYPVSLVNPGGKFEAWLLNVRFTRGVWPLYNHTKEKGRPPGIL